MKPQQQQTQYSERPSLVLDKTAFSECVQEEFDGVPVTLISLPRLKQNKLASGRHKDLDDLEHLP